MANILAFERPVVELITGVRELRELASEDDRFGSELKRLEDKAAKLAREVFAKLSPMQKVQLSRHPNRPYTNDLISRLFEDFVEPPWRPKVRRGRRADRWHRSLPRPERGRRWAPKGAHQQGAEATQLRHAEPRGLPQGGAHVRARRALQFTDLHLRRHDGGLSGLGRGRVSGQSEAIGASIEVMSRMTVPIITSVIGEGGSGGALALGVANRVLVLEFSYYSVITPEGCAAILWKSAERAPDAAARLRITAPHLIEFGIADQIVEEPPGGAHQDHDDAAKPLDRALYATLTNLSGVSREGLRDVRYHRFRKLGAFVA